MKHRSTQIPREASGYFCQPRDYTTHSTASQRHSNGSAKASDPERPWVPLLGVQEWVCKAPAWHTTRTLTAVYHTQHRKPRGAGTATAEPLPTVNTAERKARINLITPSVRDTFSCPSGDKGSCEGHPTSGLLLRTRSSTAKRPRYHTETRLPLSNRWGIPRLLGHTVRGSSLPALQKTKYHSNRSIYTLNSAALFFTESLYELGNGFSQSLVTGYAWLCSGVSALYGKLWEIST